MNAALTTSSMAMRTTRSSPLRSKVSTWAPNRLPFRMMSKPSRLPSGIGSAAPAGIGSAANTGIGRAVSTAPPTSNSRLSIMPLSVSAVPVPYSNLRGFWHPSIGACRRAHGTPIKAVYNVRVVEIPTPRWTTCDAKHFGVKLPTDVPASIQERACTRPIWYSPA
ncbi:MAG: DUF3604 domain-containing protein [Sandarakinorhabdus sp.]|nr:DUF3604 domain-containing protein [Sandarakinorhabdus sp.]